MISKYRNLPLSGCMLAALLLLMGGCGKTESPAPSAATAGPTGEKMDEFTQAMYSGKNYLDKGEAEKAIAPFAKAVALDANHPDAQLNLANAQLLAGQAAEAFQHADKAIALDHNSAAAHYVAGCALARQSKFEEAIKELQTSRNLDPTVAAASFQLALAHFQLKHWEDAISELQNVLAVEPEHPSANYNLSQALIRANRNDEANLAMAEHQKVLAKLKGPPPTPGSLEKCKHTLARMPFKLEQPPREGIKVVFSDQTAAKFGNGAALFGGPVGIIDINQRGANDLFVLEKGKGFRVLLNTNGTFQTLGEPLPAKPDGKYAKCLVADLQNDRVEDVIVLGEGATHVFKFATNGAATEVTPFTRLNTLRAVDGALVDLDFTGKLDLLAITAETNAIKVFRNLGNLYFKDGTSTSGVPSSVVGARRLVLDDWSNDDMMDLIVAREGLPPMLMTKERGGPLVPTNSPPAWGNGAVMAVGDLDNDLRPDMVVLVGNTLEVTLNGGGDKKNLSVGSDTVTRLYLVDYDNDGWLDICAAGDRLHVWRNGGKEGFVEQTAALGLDKFSKGPIASVHFADFDGDCDTDLLVCLKAGGLAFLRNDGGNANQQVKIHLMGNRSNASGIGVRSEVSAGGLRAIRTVSELPVEIGVGKHKQLESLTVRWFDLAVPVVDIQLDQCTNVTIAELILPSGSCPYLYAWDGKRYRFVTDLLGAAPLGLPLSETRYIEAQPEEYVWIGREETFKPKGDDYVVQITEELREVLYLDEAKLVVVDHPPNAEAHPTDKLLPGKPFPKGTVMTLENRKPLLRAENLEGEDVTDLLRENDARLVSPKKLRIPQLRGLAETHGFTLDFGALDTGRPLVLALTGWLRFGGGMANVAAAQDATLPYPFPTLQVETASGEWKPVDVTVGAPAGKTKTILVDLTGKLPAGAKRLKLQAAFEIHWDRAALFEKSATQSRMLTLKPSKSDLHWRGFSEFKDLPPTFPLTPDYDKVRQRANWRITPMGWCTRYGEVDELLAKRDEALVLLNGGDELTLRFPAAQIPPKPDGLVRDFFLYTDGWDKDADFHVARGRWVEPLPFHGMDDQLYGQEARKTPEADALMAKYNTRWVGPMTLQRPKSK